MLVGCVPAAPRVTAGLWLQYWALFFFLPFLPPLPPLPFLPPLPLLGAPVLLVQLLAGWVSMRHMLHWWALEQLGTEQPPLLYSVQRGVPFLLVV